MLIPQISRFKSLCTSCVQCNVPNKHTHTHTPLELFDGIYDIDTVRMAIYQPRRENVSVCVMAKDVECHNVNYADFKLRRISASILGLEEFDEEEFERQIKEIVALEDGSLEYHFREGRVQTWQRM